MPWFAIYSKPSTEPRTVDRLSSVPVPSFYPFFREKKRVTRRGSSRLVTVEVPAFPRYLFADLDDHHIPAVRAMPEVSAIVSCRGEPIVVPEGVIWELQRAADPDGCLEERDFTKKQTGDFPHRVGDRVVLNWEDRIVDGLLGVLSSLSRLKSHGEVGVFLKMLGSEREIRVPARVVRRYIPDSAASAVGQDRPW